LDTAIINGGLGATYKFSRYFMLATGYLFDTATARGGDIGGRSRDISFIAHSGFVSPTIKIYRPAVLRLRYSFQYTRFTTDLSQDLDNFGRRIGSHTVSVGLNYMFTPRVSANLSYDWVIKDSNWEFSNYTQNRYLAGMTYSLK
jgi:long-subunit fatty acid transport protein